VDVAKSAIESGRVCQQLAVKQALATTAKEMSESRDDPNSKLMRIVRMAGKDNVRARKAFMKLLCAGLSKNALLSSLQSIKKKKAPPVLLDRHHVDHDESKSEEEACGVSVRHA
jgi:hypothetical protein